MGKKRIKEIPDYETMGSFIDVKLPQGIKAAAKRFIIYLFLDNYFFKLGYDVKAGLKGIVSDDYPLAQYIT